MAETVAGFPRRIHSDMERRLALLPDP